MISEENGSIDGPLGRKCDYRQRIKIRQFVRVRRFRSFFRLSSRWDARIFVRDIDLKVWLNYSCRWVDNRPGLDVNVKQMVFPVKSTKESRGELASVLIVRSLKMNYHHPHVSHILNDHFQTADQSELRVWICIEQAEKNDDHVR